MPDDLWRLIHAERRALADDLDGLPPDSWTTPSLCSRWSVLDVLGHITATERMTAGGFLTSLAAAGFKFERMLDKALAAEIKDGPVATLANFQANADRRTSPPGPKATWLGEAILHAEDIRRPLHITHAYDPLVLVKVAEFYKGSNAIVGAKKRIAGLRLSATDTKWSTGSRPDVQGPVLSLVLAMTGRAAGLDDLSGTGVDQLRQRISVNASA